MRLAQNPDMPENLSRAQIRFGPQNYWYGAVNGTSTIPPPPTITNPYLNIPYTSDHPTPLRLWNELVLHLCNWYWEPDLEALRMVLSTLALHYATKELPFWLFVVGDSGLGKTVLFIEPFLKLPRTHLISTVTQAAFMSGTNPSASLIGPGKTSEVFLFKDFTTILSMDVYKQRAVLSTLREIADGSLNPRFGSITTPPWNGRVTSIAATTPAVELFLANERLYGDRFFSIYLHRPSDDRQIMRWAARQEPQKQKIQDRTNTLIKDLLNINRMKTYVQIREPNYEFSAPNRLEALGMLVPKLRVYATRNWKREIIDVPSPEVPTRFGKALFQIARGHAILFGKPTLDNADYALSYRLAQGTLPKNRKLLLRHLPLDERIPIQELRLRTQMPHVTFKEEIEDLRLQRILRTHQDDEDESGFSSAEGWAEWHPQIKPLLRDSEILSFMP